MSTFSERDLTFNVVWVGRMFRYLQPFAASLIDHSDVQLRMVANGLDPDEYALVERFGQAHPDRVCEVLEVAPDGMEAHGIALDRVRAIRDDGPLFCMIDPDIKAKDRWVGEFLGLLESHEAVTSGTEVWTTDNLIPDGHPGIPGEYYYDSDGFCFGSPHLALYRRDLLDETAERWGVGLGSAGPDLSPAAKAQLASMGHGHYIVFDTGKVLNALFQGDGRSLVHHDIPQLVHIGGLTHFLNPSWYVSDDDGEEIPEWGRHEALADRLAVTRFTALTLRAFIDGDPAPAIPASLAPPMAERLHSVHAEVTDMVERYRDWMVD